MSIPTEAGSAIDIGTALSNYPSSIRNDRIGNCSCRDRFDRPASQAAVSPSTSVSDVVFRVATHHQDRLSAYALVYRRYREAGLIESNPHKIRVTRFHLEPTTTVFVGMTGREIDC